MRIFERGKIGKAGLSLVELIISMAILAVVGTAIGGAMYVSSRSFTRGSAEVNVQEEAQVSSNLICDWLVDATSVNFDDTNPTEITIIHDGIDSIRVYYSAGELKYFATEASGATHDGTLAKNVTGVKFGSTFDKDRNVTVSVDYLVNGRTYHAVTDTTSRNFGFISNGGVGASNPIINIQNLPVTTVSGATHYLVYLEPNQTFNINCTIYNWTAGSFDIDALGNSDTTLTKNTTSDANVFDLQFTTSNNAGKDDGAARSFKLTATDVAGGIDVKYVDVYIRRVNHVYFSNHSNDMTATPVTGLKGCDGTTFSEVIDLGAQNWTMDPVILAGKYDSDLTYIDPTRVEVFVKNSDGTPFTGLNLTLTEAKDNGGQPKLDIELTQDLTNDVYIIIAIPHAGGITAEDANKQCTVAVNNKATVKAGSPKPYTISGRYYAVLTLAKKGGYVEPFNGVGGGIRRGAPASTIADFNAAYKTYLENYLKEHYWEWAGKPEGYVPTMQEIYDANPTFCSVMYYRVHREGYDANDPNSDEYEADGDYTGYFVLDNVRNYEDLFSDWTGRRLRDSAASLFNLDTAYDVKVEIKVRIGDGIHNCGYSTGSVPAAQAMFYNQSTGYFSPTVYGPQSNGTINYMNIDNNASYSNGSSNGWDNCLVVPVYVDSCILNSQKPSYIMQELDSDGKWVTCANQNNYFANYDRWAEGSFTLGSSPFQSGTTTYSYVRFDEDNGFAIAPYAENDPNYKGCNVQILSIKNSSLTEGHQYRVVWQTPYKEAQTVNSGTICANCQYSSHNALGSVDNMQNINYVLTDVNESTGQIIGTTGCLYINVT